MTSLLETRRINETQEGVTILLNILGKPDTLVTDNTRIDDFVGGVDILRSLSLDCAQGDYLYEIAQRMDHRCSDE